MLYKTSATMPMETASNPACQGEEKFPCDAKEKIPFGVHFDD